MFRIISWNIACLPNKINFFRNPNKKINSIIDKVLELDANIICLQEVFDFDIMDKVRKELETQNYNIHTSKKEGLISKNGLLTATKNDMLDTNEIDFSMYTGAEYVIKKGILTSKINYNNQEILIHNTHLQSNSIYTLNDICCLVRQKQKEEMYSYLENNKNKINILAGDLNDDFNTVEHQDLLTHIPFSEIVHNTEKLLTFPKYEEQLDYIILNKKINSTYWYKNTVDTKLSDHNIIGVDLDF